MAKNYRDEDFENESTFGEEEEQYFDDEEQLYDEEQEDGEYLDGEEDEYDEYTDGEEAEEEYDDGYSDEEYDEEEYEDEYTEEEEDPEEFNDGSSNPIFARLNKQFAREESEEGDEEEYADEDTGDYADEYEDELGYEDEDDGDSEGGEPGKLTSIMDRLSALADNDIAMYVLLILLPPLGLLIMFYSRKWESRKRNIWTVISGICLLLWIIILLPGGSNDVTINDDPFNSNNPWTANPSQVVSNATDIPQVTATNVPAPSETVHVVAPSETTGTEGLSYVYATNSGVYYHMQQDCGGITNASKITFDVVTSRNLAPCPDCAGGNNPNAEITSTTTYYATTNGKSYHTDPTCSGMKGASVVTLSSAIAAGKTACSVCIGYYGTPGGNWYHNVSNCQSMNNAVVKTESEWKALGKTKCPVCMGDGTGIKGNTVPTETQVFATSTGTYFHTKSDCSGMKGASQNSISRAANMGKTPCPTCVKPSTIMVFATANGTYYHTSSTCTGMKGAQYVKASDAISLGKTACPTCAKMLTGKNFGTTVNNNTSSTTDASTYVYCTTGGTYFHTSSTCSGMSGAKKVTFANATTAGKKPCPTCVTPAKIQVFCTAGGKYFHTNPTCSGMTGASQMTASKAIGYGKSACPTCAKSLASTKKSDAGTAAKTQTASIANGVSVPVWSNLSNTSSMTASAASTVYIDLSGENTCYHLTAKCPATGFANGHAVTLSYALDTGYNGCPACNPPAAIAGTELF